MAGRLIDRFGSLPATLSAAGCGRLGGVPEAVAAHLRSVQQAMLHALRVRAADRLILNSTVEVADYLGLRLRNDRAEQMLALFLDTGNRLIREEIMAVGSLASVECPSRAIVARALELGAARLIIAHNHPSGCAAPSPEDRRATAELVRAAALFDIKLLDHFVIGDGEIASFRQLGLL
ncbi:JAB domain-containing protein [Sphingomonas quercus]|nr:DNA repair protein RadC [Sphingomonas quercus]